MKRFIRLSILSLVVALLGSPPGFAQLLEAVKPWLGIAIEDNPKGVLVKTAIPGTPAEKGGILKGDLIINIDSNKMETAKGVIAYISAKGVGTKVKVELLRGGKTLVKEMELVARPDMVELASKRLMNLPAPQFKLKTVYGSDSGTLADHKGKVVLLQFWATWCPACRSSHATISSAAKELAAKGLVVLAVSSEDPQLIKKYLKAENLHFNGVSDPNDEVAGAYGVPALPMMVVIDRKGIVRHVVIGAGSYVGEILKAAEDELAKKD